MWACKKLKPRMEGKLEWSQDSVFLVLTFYSLGYETSALSFFILEWEALVQMIVKTLSIYITGSLRSQGLVSHLQAEAKYSNDVTGVNNA